MLHFCLTSNHKSDKVWYCTASTEVAQKHNGSTICEQVTQANSITGAMTFSTKSTVFREKCALTEDSVKFLIFSKFLRI